MQNMCAAAATHKQQKKWNLPSFHWGTDPHRYLDHPRTSKGHWKELCHHLCVQSMAFQATFKETLSIIHKNFYEDQTGSFRMARRMWHRTKQDGLSRWLSKTSAHRKEPRLAITCQINAEFFLGKIRTMPQPNPIHHVHKAKQILLNHHGRPTDSSQDRNYQWTYGRSLSQLSRSMRSSSN